MTNVSQTLDLIAQDLHRLDYDRWLTVWFAPLATRDGLLALYALYLELARIREQVTQPILGHMRLQWWRDALDKARAGHRLDHPVLRVMPDVLLGPDAQDDLDALLSARECDMEDQPFETLQEMEQYARNTAGRALCLALRLLGPVNERARQAALDIGTAYSLVGLMRAQKYFIEHGRIYWPRDMLGDSGLNFQDSLDKNNPAALKKMVAQVTARAVDYLQSGAAARRACTRDERRMLKAVGLARLYARRLRRADYDLESPLLFPLNLARIAAVLRA